MRRPKMIRFSGVEPWPRTAEYIRRKRAERGFSQAKVAARMGVVRPYVVAIEYGRRMVSVTQLRRLVAALELNSEEQFALGHHLDADIEAQDIRREGELARSDGLPEADADLVEPD